MNLKMSLEIAIAKKGIKKKDLAEALNTSSQQVSNWISSGSIKQTNIVEIADYFEMQVSEFIALGESA